MKLSKKVAVAASAGALGLFAALPASADELSDIKARLEKLEKAPSVAEAPVTHRGFKLVDKADTTVQLYGLIDLTLGAKTNAGTINTPNAGRTAAGAYTGWLSGNRWGINVSHVIDKASGLKVIQKLEGEYLGWTG